MPWRLIGETVTVRIVNQHLRVTQAGVEVAHHTVHVGRCQRVIDAAHLAGVVGAPIERGALAHGPVTPITASPTPALLRPLVEYEWIAGGGW